MVVTLGGVILQDNKCSWNINVALKHATEEQRKQLDVSLAMCYHDRTWTRLT